MSREALLGEARQNGHRSKYSPGVVVTGTDGSASAREAVQQAAALAAASGSELHIVGGHGAGERERARATLEDAAREVRRSGLRVWLHAVTAGPVEAICSVARRTGAGLVVVGNRGVAESQADGQPAICTQVEQHAPCSVIVVDTEPYWQVRTLKEEAPERSARRGRLALGRDWQVLLISTLAVFMALLDVTIVNIAFPAIHRSFSGTSLSDLSWVLNAYNVVVAALLVPAGRLADRLGRRRMFFVGLGVFLLGSALCGAAPSAIFLIGARGLQAAGSAMLIPASFGLVLAEFRPERRAAATSVWAAAGAVAAATGPSLGGVLVQTSGWRWVFFVNLILALGVIPGRKVLRESRDLEVDRVPDLLGGVILAGGIGALALGIVKAPDWGWGSTRVIGLWIAAAVLLLALLRRSRSHPSPVIEPELLRIRSFAAANGGFFMFSMAFYALLLGNILFLTNVWGYSVLKAGFAVTPGPLMAAVAAAAGGRLTERLGPRKVALPALVLFAGACLIYRGVGPTPAYLADWLPAQLVSGASIGLAFASLATASVMDLPENRVATGTAVQSAFRQIGAVLGIALLIAVIGSPTPLTAMHVFEKSWLLMAVAAIGAAAFALRLPSVAVAAIGAGPLRHSRRPIEVPGMLRSELVLHGHRVIVRTAGSGPPLLLVHGLLEDSLTWRKVAPALALNHTVIAPDLLGHGESDGPLRADYSLGAHALLLREVLDALGHQRVDVVGHSLGGSIALAFAGHHGDRVRRLALIAPGGFGRELHPFLRMVALPGTGPLIRMFSSAVPRHTLRLLNLGLRRAGARGAARAVRELGRVLQGFSDAGARAAFLRSVRSVIDPGGQSACAIDQMDTLSGFPMLVLWGTRDSVIPVAHAAVIDRHHPEAEIVLLDGVGHVPHIAQPAFVAERVSRFLGSAPSRPGSPGPESGLTSAMPAPAAPAADALAPA